MHFFLHPLHFYVLSACFFTTTINFNTYLVDMRKIFYSHVGYKNIISCLAKFSLFLYTLNNVWTWTKHFGPEHFVHVHVCLLPEPNQTPASLVALRTGSGKTLPMMGHGTHNVTQQSSQPLDYDHNDTISLLKCLQVIQKSDFNKKYGINTVVINNNTKSENFWWDISCIFTQENVHHIASRTLGKAQHITFLASLS